MRRSIIVATAATTGVALVLLASAVSGHYTETNKARYHQKVQNLAFCEKAYEIAASFPSYAGSKAQTDEEKQSFMNKADYFTSRQEGITNALETDIREEGEKYGIAGSMFDSMLNHYRVAAERKAIKAFQSTLNPNDVIRRLNGLCSNHFKK